MVIVKKHRSQEGRKRKTIQKTLVYQAQDFFLTVVHTQLEAT